MLLGPTASLAQPFAFSLCSIISCCALSSGKRLQLQNCEVSLLGLMRDATTRCTGGQLGSTSSTFSRS